MSEFSFVKESANNQTPDETLLVLTYEIKNIAVNNYNLNRDFNKVYITSSEIDIADTISMIRMFCEQVNINYDELQDLHSFMNDIANISNADLINNIWINLGSVINSYHYLKRFGNTKQHGNLNMHLSKLKYCIMKYCTCLGLNYRDLKEIGEEHYLERMRQLKEQGLKDQLKEEYR